jgi:hypothetical protein
MYQIYDTGDQKPHNIHFKLDMISVSLIPCSECFITAWTKMKTPIS